MYVLIEYDMYVVIEYNMYVVIFANKFIKYLVYCCSLQLYHNVLF